MQCYKNVNLELVLTFDEDRPDDCPPTNSLEIEEDEIFFRAVKAENITDRDFLSWVNLGMRPRTEPNCKCWGLSVWKNIDAVHHARNITPSVAEQYVALGKLNKDDGVWLPTPTRPQEKHCTLWNDITRDIKSKFHVVMPPAIED